MEMPDITQRLRFATWQPEDGARAQQLWGNEQVTRYITLDGMDAGAIAARLNRERQSQLDDHCAYWPLFERNSGKFVGCCGLHAAGTRQYELGYHLLPEFWGHGYATEAARAAIDYARDVLRARTVVAGHHPDNLASARIITKLGFKLTGTEYYAPTGREHPTYVLTFSD